MYSSNYPKIVNISNLKNIYQQFDSCKLNIVRLSAFRKTPQYRELPFKERLQVCKVERSQRVLLGQIVNKINTQETMNFSFGG